MNILFLSIARMNNIEDKGIYTDLLRQFRDNGHRVYVVSPLEKRLGRKTEYILENDVQFLRVRIGNITKTNLLEKGISTLMIEHEYLKAIKEYLENVNFDLVIYSTPPITFEKVIQYLKNRDSARTYLLLKDIFPQNAVDLRMFSKTSPLYWYFRKKEKKLYRNSDYIGCMSQANVDYLLKHNPEISADIVEVCPNSIEPIQIEKNRDTEKEIRDKYGIPHDKTVFIYGGNLGKPQGIGFIMECLEANHANEEIFFLIVGSGTEYKRLKDYFDHKKPANAVLLSELLRSDYDVLANSCDAGLIFLDRRFTIPNFPSRLLSYMQASMPVLAATDVNTDLGDVIEKGKFWFWCESGDVEAFNCKLQLLCDADLRKQMGQNARKYLENHFTVKHTYEIIKNHFA